MKALKFCLIFSIFLIACSAPEPEKTDAEKAADQITGALNDLKDGIGGAAKDAEGSLGDAISQISDAVKDIEIEGVSNKKPVNFRKLKELLPEDVDGFELEDISGESTGAMGFNISTTKAKYQKGDKKVSVDLVDAGGVGTAFMGMASWSIIDIDKETSDGFERTTKYKGYKAYEKCRNDRCEFAVFVASRFLLTIKGNGVDIDDLHDIADDIGLDNLEDMKDTFGE